MKVGQYTSHKYLPTVWRIASRQFKPLHQLLSSSSNSKVTFLRHEGRQGPRRRLDGLPQRRLLLGARPSVPPVLHLQVQSDRRRGAETPLATGVSERVPPRRRPPARQEQERRQDTQGEAGEDRAEPARWEAESRQRHPAHLAGGGRGHTPGQGLRVRLRDGVPRETGELQPPLCRMSRLNHPRTPRSPSTS